MWMRLTRTSVTPLRNQPKRQSHAGIEITIFRVGMQSLNPSIELSCSLLRETTQVWLLQLCLPSLTESGGINGPRQFGALTSPTLVEKRKVFLTILLVGHDTLLVTVPFQPMLLHLSWLEMGNTRLLIASHLDVSLKKFTDLWRATTPDAVNISDNFSQREFAAALQHLKPDKTPGLDSICSELILHAGAALKSWLRDFLSSCLRRLKIPKIWRRALVVAIPKPKKPVRDQRVIERYLCSVSPTRSSRGLSTPAFNH